VGSNPTSGCISRMAESGETRKTLIFFLNEQNKAQVSRGLKRKCINPVDINVNTGRWNSQGEVV